MHILVHEQRLTVWEWLLKRAPHNLRVTSYLDVFVFWRTHWYYHRFVFCSSHPVPNISSKLNSSLEAVSIYPWPCKKQLKAAYLNHILPHLEPFCEYVTVMNEGHTEELGNYGLDSIKILLKQSYTTLHCVRKGWYSYFSIGQTWGKYGEFNSPLVLFTLFLHRTERVSTCTIPLSGKLMTDRKMKVPIAPIWGHRERSVDKTDNSRQELLAWALFPFSNSCFCHIYLD